ncbi:DUF3592 domain-containing protein [Nocardioides sp. GY 10127]|uniref:DUF3592 domain-containing protein n=1 Tax=Nocardioides sp. GY 10127 TaxID=2569762 RepID=UPI0010A7E1FF|nr:DUF3592 domain-containing protein [Nocardioides sp. GY 10127]TIC84285.1 DUF3592 domain-containing protein [Nocardioides sp. GY 10127]
MGPVDVLLAVVTVLLLAAAGWLALRGGRQRAEAREFDTRAVEVEGEVLETRAKDVAVAGEPRTIYFHLVSWALPDGRTVRAETMTGIEPPVPRVGDTVTLRYDRSHTDRVVLARADHVTGAGATSFALARVLLGVGLAVPVAWVLVSVLVLTL